MRAVALSLPCVTLALAVLALAGPAVSGQPLLDAAARRNDDRAGIPAVLVTDTAFLRHPNYHTRNDTAATLDYVRMARVVDGVYSAVQSHVPTKEAHV